MNEREGRGDMIESISHAVHTAEGSDEHADGVVALALPSPPTNQQIINAAKNAYAKYEAAVDAQTMALVQLISSGSMLSDVQAIDAMDWQGSGSIDKVVDPFYAASGVTSAIAEVAKISDLHSFSVGVFTKAMPAGGPGVIGADRDVRGNTSSTAELLLALDLYRGLVDVTDGQNLQFGSWLPAAGQLNDTVTGFYITTSVQGVQVNLKILLTTSLDPYGFLSSTGATVRVPVTAGVFAGTTSSPTS
jgi:hypothetical protein